MMRLVLQQELDYAESNCREEQMPDGKGIFPHTRGLSWEQPHHKILIQ